MKMTQLDLEVTELIWRDVRRDSRVQELGLWNISREDLANEIAKAEMTAGPWQYWFCRQDETRPFEVGNIRLVKVEEQIEKANVLSPGFPVTDAVDREDWYGWNV